VRRVTLFALLAASVLLAGTLQAQRRGGEFPGGASRGVVSGLGAESSSHSGHSRSHRPRNAGIYYPLYDEYGEPLEYDQPAPPLMVTQPQSRPATPEPPAANPKVIELPGAASSTAFKPLPPATFILTNGERLESRRYLLTHDNLYLTMDRGQRTIPLATLNIDATVAADRERGIELRIPAGQGEISLGF